MKKERTSNMRLITSDKTEVNNHNIDFPEMIGNKEYHSDPLKRELYSKLLAYKQSQNKFTVQDLIRNSLK